MARVASECTDKSVGKGVERVYLDPLSDAGEDRTGTPCDLPDGSTREGDKQDALGWRRVRPIEVLAPCPERGGGLPGSGSAKDQHQRFSSFDDF